MSRLFQPILVGPTALEHRVAMAPLTRYRWGDDWDATGTKSMIKGQNIHREDYGQCSVEPIADCSQSTTNREHVSQVP